MTNINESREYKFRLLCNELIDSSMEGKFTLSEFLIKKIRAFTIEDMLDSPQFTNDEKAKLRKELKILIIPHE